MPLPTSGYQSSSSRASRPTSSNSRQPRSRSWRVAQRVATPLQVNSAFGPGPLAEREGAQAVAEEVVGLQDLALERRSPADGGIEGLDPLDPRAGAVERFGDQQDVAEAALLKVVQGLFDGVGVVQADQVGIQLGQLAVHQHHRQFAVQGAQFAGMVAEGVHNQSFDVVGLQGGQVMTFLLVVAVGIAHTTRL